MFSTRQTAAKKKKNIKAFAECLPSLFFCVTSEIIYPMSTKNNSIARFFSRTAHFAALKYINAK